ncbi:glycosyltransferase [Mucilaginibacter sabulilitoris]|uniref:Glycosyltransferase n=1 Tax=Mucilaginibacter sabulilitoris TaxID=1173583 RepID=A0ABZ0TRQ0_9SPHI|nr:glycosyltransferase [Mucilaginibacter sabulilitoris]WPU95801.1 glycosyltransferase [Mucilaginibacter sabulilitoris]
MEQLVTIAIPVFNAEKTIALAIKSVLKQSYKNWELIIINDGSKDRSIKIIHEFLDHRIRIVDDNINRGLINRLNSIPTMANGKYIARMDADDIMHPERIAKQVYYMESNPDIDVVDCAIYTIDDVNQVKGIRNMEDLPKTKDALLFHCMFTHPAILGKKEWFIKYPYDYNYYRAEDYELWLRAYDDSKYGRVKLPLLFYREGNVNISNYINSMKSVRKIIRCYGPALVSPFDNKVAIFKSYIKQLTYLIFGLFKAQGLLVSRRNSKLSLDEQKRSAIIIVGVINYK